MALLMSMQRADGEWDVVVLERLGMTMLQDRSAMRDILGRALPAFGAFKAYDGVPRDGAVRLANALRGMSRNGRVQYFEAQLPQLKLTMTGR